MITKFSLLISLLIFSCTTYSQVVHLDKLEKTFYDADSTYLGAFYYTGRNLDSTIYVRMTGEKVNVLFLLPKYQGGYKSLRNFIDKQFIKIKGWQETNASCLVYILLMNNKIEEIRIGKRIGYNYSLKYDAEIKRILLLTQGNWSVKRNKTNKPVLFAYLFHFK